MFDKRRIIELKSGPLRQGTVVYWMSRDQRVEDNWALIYAYEKALETRSPLKVLFCITPAFLNAGFRQYSFMLKGLQETSEELEKLNIPFNFHYGNPESIIPRFLSEEKAALLVSDFDPLKLKKEWKITVARHISIPFHDVDAHNIVPCCIVSEKEEHAAYTLRPKIKRLLNEFLTEFPKLDKFPFNNTLEFEERAKHDNTLMNLKPQPKETDKFMPGSREAFIRLNEFIINKLPKYSELRNDPNTDYQSNLSPYLHYGHISSQRIALEISKAFASGDEQLKQSIEAFLEELIIRKELADNFCHYNHKYDNYEGFPEWARTTLEKHSADEREYIYDLNGFEMGHTHDPLWNAAQLELVWHGKMHGYLRMYWAKKILEWTPTPAEALRTAIYLNDKYGLDGRDPNGYAGIAWSIGGVHDRPWFERPVFGKIRYMNYNGCARKFDVHKYIEIIHSTI